MAGLLSTKNVEISEFGSCVATKMISYFGRGDARRVHHFDFPSKIRFGGELYSSPSAMTLRNNTVYCTCVRS